MRVAFITHYTSLYGANRSLLNLIEGLRAYDVVPYVIAPSEGVITYTLQDLGVEFATIPLEWWVSGYRLDGNSLTWLYRVTKHKYYSAKNLIKNLSVLNNLIGQLNIWNIDIIYTNSSLTPIGALAAQKLQIPHVWHLREFIDLDYNYSHDWGKRVFNHLVSKANARITISQAIRSHLVNNCSFDTTPVIYNGVASEAKLKLLYQQAGEKNNLLRPKQLFTFSLVGLIHPCKGQDIAIKALALLAKDFPEIQLLLAGGGNVENLKQLASDLNILDKVQFLGYVDDPYEIYLNSDAVLMCSKNEGMGRVTVEAMSACRPAIGYDNGGTSEIIQHEQTGLLYKGSHQELAANMKRLIENPAWAKQLGQNAWQVAFEAYTIEVYAQKTYKLLLSVA